MLTIHCPACAHSLQAPASPGDGEVLCPECNTTFSVTCETGQTDEAIRTEPATQVPEEQEEPDLVPTIARNVFIDAEAERSRLVSKTFKIGMGLWLTYGLCSLPASTKEATFGGIISSAVYFLLGAPVAGLVLALFVFIVMGIISPPGDEHITSRGDKLLETYARLANEDSPSDDRAEQEPAGSLPPDDPSSIQPEGPNP